MKKPTKAEFGYTKTGRIDTVAYLRAITAWEKGFNEAARAVIEAEEILRRIKANRPRKSSFKIDTKSIKWNEKAYLKAIEEYASRPTKKAGGRPRARAVNPSWVPFLGLLDPSNPSRSANAFCDEIGLRPSTFSAMQLKEIKPTIAAAIQEWAKGKEADND
jgi:hypothetical protein